MPADRYPGATWRPIAYRAEAGRFTAPPLGVILHVVVGNGSPYRTFAGAVSPRRRFSHFWVSKAGAVEQYTETSRKSWAQGAGNGTYWSVETEGYPSEPLTGAQIAAFARLASWLGVAPRVAAAPGERGIGTHYMGGSAWGGHTCPDPVSGAGPRSKQRGAIIAAMTGTSTTLGDDMPTLKEITSAVWTTEFLPSPNGDGTKRSPAQYLLSMKNQTGAALTAARAAARDSAEALALAKEAASRGGLSDGDIAKITEAARQGADAALNERITDADVTLTVDAPQ